MKKIFYIVILCMVLLILVSCGSGDKIEATITQTSEELGGDTNVTMEIWFKKGVPSSAKSTMVFTSEEMAKGYYTILSVLSEDEEITLKQEGNTVTMEQSVISDNFGYKDMSKEEVKKALEEERLDGEVRVEFCRVLR